MKKFLHLLLLFTVLSAGAQQKTTTPGYKIIVLGKSDQPVYDARVVSWDDKEFLTNEAGEVAYPGNISTNVMIVAAGYKTLKVNLQRYPKGQPVKVYLSYLGDQTSPLNVFVRDKNNKAVPNALILVTPGVSAVTDASGFATAQHKQQPGEYIEVSVQARGYKDQRQRVLVGTGQGNSITRPTDIARFILEKGENDRTVFKINVIALDKETDKPIQGASVKLQLPDNYILNGGATNAKGESLISDEYSFEEEKLVRVMVSHPDYQEKWSDIPPDLLTAKDTDTRLYTVFLEKKKSSGAGWAGSWAASDGSGKATLNGSGSSVSGNLDYAVSDWTSKNTVSGCRETGNNKLTCRFVSNYEDSDKKVSFSGTIEMTLSGNSINFVWTQVGPSSLSWKGGQEKYQVTRWRDGRTVSDAMQRK